MFRTLLADPQEALNKQHLVYCVCVCVCVMSVGCTRIRVKLVSTTHARNIASAVCAVPPENEQVMLETCRGP
jgi:hypothetical protein